MAEIQTSRVESIDRALRLLMAMAQAPADGFALGELSSRAEMAKPTCFRALATMRMRGFVVQDARNGHYRLGPMAATLGRAFSTADRRG